MIGESGNIENWHVLLTGGTDGIGLAVLLKMVSLGAASVVVVGRSEEKWMAASSLIPAARAGSVEFWRYDLSLMRDVKRLAEEVIRRDCPLHALIHCAGVMLKKKTITSEGLETVFSVQYLARYYLSNLLRPQLEATKGRIVVVSAGGTMPTANFDFDNLQGEKYYTGVHALKHESVANDMLVLDAATRFPLIKCYNYGPGFVRTKLLSDMGRFFRIMASVLGHCISIAPNTAAEDIVTLITSQLPSGLYVRGLKPKSPSYFRADPNNQERLRNLSSALIEKALSSQ